MRSNYQHYELMPSSTYNGPKLGIIGGMGSRASTNFLRKIIHYSPAESDQQFIEIFYHNNSAVPDRSLALLNQNTSPVKEIIRSIEMFNQQNVEIIVIACITAYCYFEKFKHVTDARIIHPVEVLRKELTSPVGNYRKIGILATSGTINSGLFESLARQLNVELIGLDKHDQEDILMKSIYMKGGLKSAIISPEAKDLFYTCIPKLIKKGVEALLIACTEIPLVLSGQQSPLPIIDTIDLMVKETVNTCYKPLHSHG